MTSRQRLLAAARGEAVDRIPVSPFGLGHLDRTGPVAAGLIDTCDPFLEIGLGVNVFGGGAIEQTSRRESDYTYQTVHTPSGPLQRVIKHTDVATHTVQFPCSGPDDLLRWLEIPFEPQAVDASHFLARRSEVGEDGLLIAGCPDAICLPAELLSPEDFCLMWADARDVFEHAVDEAGRRVDTYVERACEAGVDGFRVIGGEFASTQLGPEAFERLVVEPDARLVKIMHRYDALAYCHNHGPMMRYLDAIARIGIDFLDPIEMPPFGDADLPRAREIIDGRFCIVGTFDDMELLERLPHETLVALMRERIEAYGPIGFCVGGSASGTYTERGAAAFCALAEAAREGF